MSNSFQRDSGWVRNNRSNSKRFEYSRLRRLPKWLLGDVLCQPGDDSVPGVGVAKLVSGGRSQRKPAHLIDHGFDGRALLVARFTGTQVLRQASHVTEELSRTDRRAQALECRIDSFCTGGGTGAELGKEPAHRFIERNSAIVDQCHERRSRDRFRHRGKWEQRFIRYRYTGPRLARIALRHDFAAAPHDRTDTGDSVWSDPLINVSQRLNCGPRWYCQVLLPR
jgi:hypothetical protein